MNFKGKQEPFDGSAYAGLYLYAPDDYREYIQVPLKETLEKGSRYRLTLFLSLSEKSDGAVMDMGAVFSAIANLKGGAPEGGAPERIRGWFVFQNVSHDVRRDDERRHRGHGARVESRALEA